MINLVDILRDAPQDIKLYSPIFGVVTFEGVNKLDQIETSHGLFSKEGKFDDNGEDICMLWPSKEHQSWDHWQKVLFEDGDLIVDIRDFSIYSFRNGQARDESGNVVQDLNLDYTRYFNEYYIAKSLAKPKLNLDLNRLVTSLFKYGEEYDGASFLDILRLAVKDQGFEFKDKRKKKAESKFRAGEIIKNKETRDKFEIISEEYQIKSLKDNQGSKLPKSREPKYSENRFEKGDYISYFSEVYIVESLTDHYYYYCKNVKTGGKKIFSFNDPDLDYYIKGAQLGEVLTTTNKNGKIETFIFKSCGERILVDEPVVEVFCYMVDGKVYLETETEYFGRLIDHHKTRPATTKEKNQLFSEMAKLGYEWSVKDKKLVVRKKKINVDLLVSEYSKLNKPTNSERIAFRNGILAALKEVEEDDYNRKTS